MPMRWHVIDALNTQIDAEFRKTGIEIAFPQTDLHIRSLPPQWMDALRPRSSRAEKTAES
jgi:small-conductance mechanosensitive channel